MARNAERQLHSGENDETLLLRQGRSALIGFFVGGTANVFDKHHVVVIGNRNPLQTAQATGLDKLVGVRLTLVVGDGPAARPILVTRRMHLQIATVEMRSLVHRLPKTQLLVDSKPNGFAWKSHPHRC
ncbi:hypothetical protein LMTR13_26595 [Bradyrhizobium icense]|uniref:Uncharacterized protein n=1 Tax=Bradyrhizobium icense TaxID=1274631 RepID=A0A1B1UKA0_9BRAD|nr:hypothetical protein LMTR13_26595 [Bradyrhizobium icense]